MNSLSVSERLTSEHEAWFEECLKNQSLMKNFSLKLRKIIDYHNSMISDLRKCRLNKTTGIVDDMFEFIVENSSRTDINDIMFAYKIDKDRVIKTQIIHSFAMCLMVESSEYEHCQLQVVQSVRKGGKEHLYKLIDAGKEFWEDEK